MHFKQVILLLLISFSITHHYFPATRHGFPNNIHTYGLISGMWTSFFALGAFLGPTISGVLFDYFGFRNSINFVIGLQILVATMFLLFGLFYNEKPRLLESSLMDDKNASVDADENSLLVPNTCGYGYGSTYEQIEWFKSFNSIFRKINRDLTGLKETSWNSIKMRRKSQKFPI